MGLGDRMTLTAGADDRVRLAPSRDRGERRASTSGPRLSWASPLPFVRRPTADNGPETRQRTWAVASHGYVRHAGLLDAVLLVTIWASCTALGPVAVATAPLVVSFGVAGTLIAIAVSRGYDRRVVGTGYDEFQAILKAGAGVAAAIVSVGYAVGRRSVPVLMVVVVVSATVVILSVGRYLLRRRLRRRRRVGQAIRRVVVVGPSSAAGGVVAHLGADPTDGYEVVGMCVPFVDPSDDRAVVPVLGAVADVVQVVADKAVDEVVVTPGALGAEALRRLSWALDRAGAELVVMPEIDGVAAPRLHVRPVGELTMLRVELAAPRGRLMAKAAIDRVVGVLLMVAALPLVALASVVVAATSPGSPFYRQQRVGVDGQTFTMWKLRSMYVDADARRDALHDQDEGAGVLFKVRADPRITSVGRWLRRFSVDELPQLWNVVKGDMSLVGPRPPLLSEVDGYADPVRRRLRVKPGLTGLWQVSGRSDLSWEESVRLDLSYVDNWSVAMDLMILWRTLHAVVRGAGAY